jgi:hypothetical protein
MLATVLHRLAGSPAIRANETFGDVTDGSWYAGAVAWAKENGVVNGVGDNMFAPNSEVTRQDLAVIIANYAGFANKQLPAARQYQAFADEADIAEYAKSAVRTLYSSGITAGKPNHLFDPKAGATRAEVAAILRRFIKTVR